jgi:hypothetical protein
MAKPVSFKDFMIVDYRPGEPEEINYRAYKRKRNTNLNGVEEQSATKRLLDMWKARVKDQ